MDQAARHPALQRLDALVGEWTMEASFAAGVTGRAVFEWVLGGQFLVERSEVPGAPDGIAIVGLDRNGEAFTQHYYDSRGVARVYAMTFSDGVWTLLRDSPDFSPLDFWHASPGSSAPTAAPSAAAGRRPGTARAGSTTST